MIDFINRHITNKQKSFSELLEDLKRYSILLDDDLTYKLLSNISSNWGIFSNNSTQLKYYEDSVNRLSEKYTCINMFSAHKVPCSDYKPSIADFFAGCGGLSEGFSQAGFSVSFVNEIVENFAESHFINHQIGADSYYVGDIGKLHMEGYGVLQSLPPLDVVCGGPPCQGFSTANRQPLIDDPRNRLYKDYLTVLSILRPKFFVMENVRGIEKKIDDISADIRQYLGAEYQYSYAFLNASDYGIPQARTRFFLIANRLGVDCDSVFASIKPSIIKPVLKDALFNLPPLGAKDAKNKSIIENDVIGYKIRFSGVSAAAQNYYIDYINNGSRSDFIFNHKNRYNNERDIEIFRRLPQGANSLHASIADIMPYSSRNHIFKDKYYKLSESEVCKTITSHMKFDCNMYIHPNEPRGLSPREAARVQSFPDSYFFRGAPNHWYTQIGNAVPVKLAKALAEAIMVHL